MIQFKRYWQQLIKFFDSSLGAQIKYYFLFYIVLWGAHLVLISLISYFHLLLNHNIRTIGDWISDRGWILIILSKILIFYLALQFIRLKNKKINLVKSYFKNSFQMPRKEIIAALLFILVALMGLGRVQLNRTMIFEPDRLILSALGTFIFFSVDYVLLIILEIFHPLHSPKDRLHRLLIFPLLFYYFSYATFIYEQIVSFRLYAFFFLLMYLGEWRRRNWSLPFVFLIGFLVPCYTVFGLDPVWSSSYTPFIMEKTISSFSVFVLVAFTVTYLYRAKKLNPEYVYRD